MQFAAGETEALPPAPPTDAEQLRQEIDPDLDTQDVRAAPGTGGPDDAGDVHVSPEDLKLPWRP